MRVHRTAELTASNIIHIFICTLDFIEMPYIFEPNCLKFGRMKLCFKFEVLIHSIQHAIL